MINLPNKTPSEHWEQSVFFVELRKLFHRWPELGLFYSIPNAAKRGRGTAKRMKDEGLKAGVPDTHLPVARDGYHSLYIEFKRRPYRSPKTGQIVRGRLSPEQKKVFPLLEAQGNRVEVCVGWEEGIETVKEYLNCITERLS